VNQPKRYGIYTARFPFLETNEGKIRPVIVISSPQGEHNAITIIPISSKPKQEDVDITLDDWESEGLIKPSCARTHRLTTMLQSDLLAELGELTPRDVEALRQAMRSFLDL
jgi:mRNA-degrading endonuclease toxin of MazEF toxin-antitoxin module